MSRIKNTMCTINQSYCCRLLGCWLISILCAEFHTPSSGSVYVVDCFIMRINETPLALWKIQQQQQCKKKYFHRLMYDVSWRYDILICHLKYLLFLFESYSFEYKMLNDDRWFWWIEFDVTAHTIFNSFQISLFPVSFHHDYLFQSIHLLEFPLRRLIYQFIWCDFNVLKK